MSSQVVDGSPAIAPLLEPIYAKVIEAAPSAMVMTDAAGQIVLVNSEAEQLFGWARGDLLGQPVEKLVPSRFRDLHPGHRSGFLDDPIKRAMGAGRELYALRKDGREVPIEIGIAPIEDGDGGLYVLATIVDLTSRRRAEQRFRVAVESSPNAIVMVDDNGVIVLVNAELERMFGYDREELLGRPIETLVPERFRGRHPEYRTSFKRDPRPRSMGAGLDLYGRHKDGNEVPLQIGLAPIETDEGTFVLASVVDISEQRKADYRFRQAVESAPNAMVMLDTTGEIVLANSRASEIFGYDQDTLLGQPAEILVPSRFRKTNPVLRGWAAAEPSSRWTRHEDDLFGLRQDGSEFPVEIGLNPIETPDGIFVLASIVDITDSKQVEEARALTRLHSDRANAELVKAKQDLERAVTNLARRNEDLDEFAYTVSHDLRSPLRAIDNLATWLLEDCGDQLEGEPKEWLTEISKRIAKMERLLDDLLQFSRSIQAASSIEATDCGALVDQISAVLDLPAGFSVRFEGELPTVRTHRVPLEQVLRNLVDNAVKHHDRPSGTVVVTGEQIDADTIELAVADDGPGIPVELRERAFALFRSLNPDSAGSGMGLAMVKRMVESRGGRITIGSNEPRGAVFRIVWPLRGTAS